MKSSQEKVQGLENKLSLTTVKKLESQRDAIIQFDYWVPMEGTCTNDCMISCDYYLHCKVLVEGYGNDIMCLCVSMCLFAKFWKTKTVGSLNEIFSNVKLYKKQ